MNAQQMAAVYQLRKSEAQQAVLNRVTTHPGAIRENVIRGLSHLGTAYVANELDAMLLNGQLRQERDNGLVRYYSK